MLNDWKDSEASNKNCINLIISQIEQYISITPTPNTDFDPFSSIAE